MILDSLLAKLAPHTCLGCATEGLLLCKNCAQNLRRIPARCYRCHRLNEEYRVCTACRSQSGLFSVVPYTVYAGVAKEFVCLLHRIRCHSRNSITLSRVKSIRVRAKTYRGLVLCRRSSSHTRDHSTRLPSVASYSLAGSAAGRTGGSRARYKR